MPLLSRVVSVVVPMNCTDKCSIDELLAPAGKGTACSDNSGIPGDNEWAHGGHIRGKLRGMCPGVEHQVELNIVHILLTINSGDLTLIPLRERGHSRHWHHSARILSPLPSDNGDILDTGITQRGFYPHSPQTTGTFSTLASLSEDFIPTPLGQRRHYGIQNQVDLTVL